MIEEDEINCSGRVLREIFSEEKLVIIYRFSLEVEKARGGIDLNVTPPGDRGNDDNAGPDSDDDSLGIAGSAGIYLDETEFKNINNCTILTLTYFVNDVKYFLVLPAWGIQQTPAPSVSNKVPESSNFRAECDGVDIFPGYWETMLDEGYANLEEGNSVVRDYVDVINLANDLSMEETELEVGNQNVVDVDGSSTGSTEVPSLKNVDVEINDLSDPCSGNGG